VKGAYLTTRDDQPQDKRSVLAERLEEKYSKAQILDAYLNFVYLG